MNIASLISRSIRVLSIAFAVTLTSLPPSLGQPVRIASINMCTDQLLLDLVPQERIAGLSPFARDRARSWAADKAAAVPLLSGGAEEILMLRPSLVVSGAFMKRETRDLIRASAIKLEEFDFVRSIGETKEQIIRFGALVGEPARAMARVAAIDAAVLHLKNAALANGLRILPLSRRGWVSGKNSLISDIMAQAGLRNASDEAGISDGAFMTLESIVKLRPDAILIAHGDLGAEDQGQAMLRHPAIATLFPLERQIVIAEPLTVCGGPMIAEAMERLAEQIATITPRLIGPDRP